MAYMNQEKKARIAQALKSVVPADWKYSLRVRHHSTIICTVTAAPFDLLRAIKPSDYFNPETATEYEVNPYHVRAHCTDDCVADVLEAIIGALNTDNYDRSDSQTDYFDCGHYVALKIGAWDRPFKVIGARQRITA
jgi:hypothetical protein